MKNYYFSAIAVMLLSGATLTLNAQDDISNIFKSGVTDLNTVAKGYLKPAGNSFSTGLGSNWYNTAEVHKTWGFDLTFGVGVVQVPSNDRMFDISRLSNLKPTVTGTTMAPSFAGTGDNDKQLLLDSTTLIPAIIPET